MLYGYNHSKELGLEPNETESAQVKQIFDWYTEHKWGTEKIARMLNLRGVPTKAGMQWAPGIIGVMIRNRAYCGEVRANGTYIQGRHQAIIDREQFDAAQAIISSRSTIPSRAQSSPHLLSGIAHCGNCGKRLSIHSINQGAKKKRYDFYRHIRDVAVSNDPCPGLSKSAALLENAVVEQIRHIALSNTMQKVLLQDVQKRNQKNITPTIKERDKLLLELASIRRFPFQW